MTNYAATATHIPAGVNQANRRVAKATIPTAMVSPNTFTVTAPAGADWTLVPIKLHVYALASVTYTKDADLTVTTHDISTGVTVLTAGGDVAQYSKVVIEYAAID